MNRTTAFALLVFAVTMTIIVGCSSPYKDVLIPPMGEVEAMTELIDQEVALTPDQRIKVREIVVDNAGMRARIQQQFAGRIIELKEQEKRRLQKFNRQVGSLLNDEQVKAWEPLYRAIYNNELEGYDTPVGGFQEYNRHDDFGGPRGY